MHLAAALCGLLRGSVESRQPGIAALGQMVKHFADAWPMEFESQKRVPVSSDLVESLSQSQAFASPAIKLCLSCEHCEFPSSALSQDCMGMAIRRTRVYS